MSYEFLLKNIDAFTNPVLLIGLDGVIKLINRAFVEAAGLSSPAPHYVGRAAEDILGKELVKSCVDLAQKAIFQKGSIEKLSFSKRNSRGEKIYWNVDGTQWLVDDLSDGVLLSFREVGRDYSQTPEHRFMDAIIDGARDALLIMTGDYRLKKVNQTFLELFGGKPEDYLKHNLREFVFEFDRFQEETKKSEQGMPFLSVLRRQDNEPVNCETVARSYPASMFASSEQSGVSEVYWILELRALEEKDNRIVEVLSGKLRMMEDKVNDLHESNARLIQQISELSVKQNQEKDSEHDKDWAENLMELSEERDRLRHAKQDAEMRLRLLQNKYNTESQAWQKDKEGILIDHQEILKEKQAVMEKLESLSQDFNDARDAMLRQQDENLALKAENDKLRLENDELSSDKKVLKQSYDDLCVSTETNQHLQEYQQATRDELDAALRLVAQLQEHQQVLREALSQKTNELEEALGLADNQKAALAESDQFLAAARQEALAQERSLAEFRQLLDEKHALQEQQRRALEEQEKNHR
ncbi:MAG TPA: PAS domain-containing protein, partial [bacterium]|nr:PAS domain-containing protein [bacterium]